MIWSLGIRASILIFILHVDVVALDMGASWDGTHADENDEFIDYYKY